jgi:hypothetical protein
MLTIPHVVVGAAIGKRVPWPWLALPAAFVSHFFLDVIPHLDTHGLFGIKGGHVTRAEAIGATVDTLVAAALVTWLVRREPRWKLLLWCAFAGAAMDFFNNIPPWGRWFLDWPGTAWLSRFHYSFHHPLRPEGWLLGFGTQAAVIAAAVLVLRGRGRSAVSASQSAQA